MNSKEYKLPNGKTAVFEYDITGVGKITLECMDELMGMIADRLQGEWIPCGERLPKRQGYYICTCKDGSKYKRTTIVKWSNGWQLAGARAYWIVLAWTLLPEPWKGTDDE